MYIGETLSLEMLDDGIAEINFNNRIVSVNKFNRKTLNELRSAIELLKNAKGVGGLLLTSSKSVFVVGADITEFSVMFDVTSEEFVEEADAVNQLFSEIEDLPYPTLAVINGFALGGGLEVCLCCDYRIMSSKASIGLPETTLGIMPGWGGTVRLPRLIGLKSALTWIARGSPQSANEALKAGAVDLVSSPNSLREEAIDYLSNLMRGEHDLNKRRSPKLHPMNIDQTEVLREADGLCNALVSRTGDNYPASLEVIKLISRSCFLSREEAIALGNQTFFELTQTSQARALIGMFLGDQHVVKQAKLRYQAIGDNQLAVRKAAVIGAGIMGGGIAYQSALKGVPIIMKDINQQALDLGMKEASKLLERGVQRGKITDEKADAIASRITPTLSDKDLSGSDIVVEAVVELESVKSSVLSELERTLSGSNSIMTSNTSTISITRLSESLKRPENFCGMHFFNPVHAMPLVEIIRGDKSSDTTIAEVCAFALTLGKKPIVVNDCPGFLVNRVLFAALLGMEMLIAEGADFEQIDRVMEAWGLPMGPAYLSDVIGLDTIVHCYSVLFSGLPERFIEVKPSRTSQVLFDSGRLGQKNGLGYYHYVKNDRGRPSRQADNTVVETFQHLFGRAVHFDDDVIIERVMLAMGMEMVRCLEEGVVASPMEADMALIYGIGFPSFRGGICRWLDELGLPKVCELGDKYTSVSSIYPPTEQLRSKAARGGSLFSKNTTTD